MKNSASLPYAIVIGMDNPTGLQSSRILKARGVPVIGIASNIKNYCCKTNACERILQSNTDSDELVDTLIKLGPTLDQRAVLFPCTDISVMILSRNREDLKEWYYLVLPDADVINTLVDKVNFYQYASAHQLPVPKTLFVTSTEEALASVDDIRFPVIIKPPFRPEKWKKEVKGKAFLAHNVEELIERLSYLFGYVDTLIVQQVIEGPDPNHRTGNCYVNQDNELVAVYTSKKIRQWPPNTGEGCSSESVIDETVVSVMSKLFTGIGYHGLGYLEMKIDEKSGEYYIIEPNIARPTGRSAAAEASGVELLYSMYCEALGMPLPDARTQNINGAKWFFLQRDIRASFKLVRAGSLTLKDWARTVRGKKVFAVFSLKDPLPMLFSIFRLFGKK